MRALFAGREKMRLGSLHYVGDLVISDLITLLKFVLFVKIKHRGNRRKVFLRINKTRLRLLSRGEYYDGMNTRLTYDDRIAEE